MEAGLRGRGPGADVPPTAHRRSPVGAIALALGAATPLFALILNQVGVVVLFIGGVLTAVVGGVGLSDAGDDVPDRTARDLATAALALGLVWVVIAVIVPLVRGA